jgi:hypothetical protein
MSQTGTSAWWADVQYLRDASERTDEARRRADRAELAARRATRDRRRVDAEVAPTPAPQRRRREPDMPPPRRRDHIDAVPRGIDDIDAVPRGVDDIDAVPRGVGYGDAAPRGLDHIDAVAHRRDHIDAVPRGVGYGDGVAPRRRTVEIRGRTVPAPAVPRTPDLDRRRPPRRAVERVGPRPDRLALWALLMGLVLILVAVTTADAATVAVVAPL